jgi:hypothetical protein
VTTARIAYQPPKRDFIGRLLLTGIPWTDANPWVPTLGLVVTGVIGALLNGWLQ